MLGEIRAMQVYTMTWKNSKKYLHSTISYKYKIVLWKFFYAGSQIRAVQIRAMRNRASRGMKLKKIEIISGTYKYIYVTGMLLTEISWVIFKIRAGKKFLFAHEFLLRMGCKNL